MTIRNYCMTILTVLFLLGLLLWNTSAQGQAIITLEVEVERGGMKSENSGIGFVVDPDSLITTLSLFQSRIHAPAIINTRYQYQMAGNVQQAFSGQRDPEHVAWIRVADRVGQSDFHSESCSSEAAGGYFEGDVFNTIIVAGGGSKGIVYDRRSSGIGHEWAGYTEHLRRVDSEGIIVEQSDTKYGLEAFGEYRNFVFAVERPIIPGSKINGSGPWELDFICHEKHPSGINPFIGVPIIEE